GADPAVSSADGDTGNDPNQSAFISQATSEDGSTSTTQPETDRESNGNHGEVSSLFGESAASDEDPAGDQPEQLANGSTPVQDSGVPVPDDELRERGLSRDDVRFLSRVLDVMNREDDEYTLLKSMRQLRDDYEDLNLERL
ncbi:ATP-binding protein, partial [Halorubrum sp. SS5]